jgi:SAM-dependent methyltransferase
MPTETRAEALARLYDLDLAEDPGDLDLYLALASRFDGPIVELGVGTGRIAAPLAAAGHEVVGVDADPAMLARARGRASGTTAHGDAESHLRLIEADIVHLTLTDLERRADQGFMLAILALNSLLLFADHRRQRKVVATMAALLEPGGAAVIDCWLPDAEDLVRFDGRLSLEWLRVDPETRREVTKLASARYGPTTGIVELTTIFEEAEPGGAPARWTRTDAMRLLDAGELAAMAEDAGLEIEQLAGDYELTPLGPGSDRAVLVARRPGASARGEG